MYTYQSTLQDALKVNWQVEELIGGDKQLDFTQPFLPESLVRSQDISCLNRWEKLRLNQIRGNSYLHLFVLVEQFIIPTVLEQVKAKGFADVLALQALLCFAEEEGKHIQLFQQFADEFKRGFGSPCGCLEPLAISQSILKHHPLSVLFLTLQFEWTTQSHYLESVRDNQEENLDPRFCDLLKHHWLEEAQHTKLDTLLVYEIANQMSEAEIETAIADYLKTIALLDNTLMQQMQLDVTSLECAIARSLTDAEKQEILTIQKQAYRWSFLCAGITHPGFIKVLNRVSPTGKVRAMEMAKELS